MKPLYICREDRGQVYHINYYFGTTRYIDVYFHTYIFIHIYSRTCTHTYARIGMRIARTQTNRYDLLSPRGKLYISNKRFPM